MTASTLNGNHPGARVPPHSLEAETALLGAMLLTPTATAEAVERVSVSDFYKPAHGHVFEAIARLWAEGTPADPVTVAEALKRVGLLDAIGGAATLIDLQANCPATTSAARYAAIVAEQAQLRRLIAAAAEITDLAYASPADVAGAVEQAVGLIEGASTMRRETAEARTIGDALGDWLDGLEYRYDHGAGGIRTGLVDLDDLLMGLHPGQLVTVGARPGMGKSLLGAQIAAESAKEGHPTLLVGVEMPTEQTVGRMMSAEANIDFGKIRSGKLSENDFRRIAEGIGRLGQRPLRLIDDPAATVASVRAACRRHADTELLVVDYLQLLSSSQRSENRQLEVSEISGGLRRIAREMGIAVVALAQLSRNLEQRADKRPILSDLRESGRVEADSDVVIGLYRDELYHPDSPDRGTAELIVLKQRNGPIGTVKVAFLNMAFRSMARL